MKITNTGQAGPCFSEQGNGMFPKRRILDPQPGGWRGQNPQWAEPRWRSERSGGNMPFPCPQSPILIWGIFTVKYHLGPCFGIVGMQDTGFIPPGALRR